MADGRHLENRKIAISFGNCLVDFVTHTFSLQTLIVVQKLETAKIKIIAKL